MKATKSQMEEWLRNEILCFSTIQKGYGRQGLYVEWFYLMDVFPNIKEHFNIHHEDDSFYNEEEKVFTDSNGNEIDEKSIYSNLNKFLCKNLQGEIQEIIDYMDDEDE